MNYRKIAVLSIIFTIIIGLLFSNIEVKEKRYHQHKEARVRAEDVVTKDKFATHLPIIDIKTEKEIPPSYKITKLKDGKEKKEKNYDVVKSSVKYIQNENTENKLDDKPVFETNAYIRTRGNSSRGFEKKGYFIEFKNNDYTDNRDIEIDGMVKDSEWVLHGPFLDKTLIRNYVAYNIAGEMMDYSPNVRFCEMFINGEYMGLYLIVEKIKYNEEGRIKITKSNPKHSSTSYIIKIDRPAKDEKFRLEGLLNVLNPYESQYSGAMEIIYPKKTMTKEQYDYIFKDIVRTEKTLISRSFLKLGENNLKYIDVDSFVDYFILNEFTGNADAMTLSTYVYKDLRGKLKMVTWDHNSSFDNYKQQEFENSMIFEKIWWYKYLFKNDIFTNRVIKRYYNLRKNILSDEYLINYIDETVKYLGPAIDRNYKRWPSGLKFDMLYPRYRNQHSHEEAIDYMKKAIIKRGKYLDKNIKTLKRHSHKSMIQE